MTAPFPILGKAVVDLGADARNRALRTFLVAIATDVAIALVLVVVTAFSRANTWGDIEWAALGFLLAKTAITSAGAYVLRKHLDPSALPTPLPPAPVPEPNDDQPRV